MPSVRLPVGSIHEVCVVFRSSRSREALATARASRESNPTAVEVVMTHSAMTGRSFLPCTERGRTRAGAREHRGLEVEAPGLRAALPLSGGSAEVLADIVIRG